jgi:hypothetical protein
MIQSKPDRPLHSAGSFNVNKKGGGAFLLSPPTLLTIQITYRGSVALATKTYGYRRKIAATSLTELRGARLTKLRAIGGRLSERESPSANKKSPGEFSPGPFCIFKS